jgi:hypothetical protein
MGNQLYLSINELKALLKIENFLKSKIRKFRTSKRLKALKNFKPKLLAVYKGFILRKKILKSLVIKNILKDLKLMKRKLSVERSNRMTY